MTPRAQRSSLLIAVVCLFPASARAQADADKATARQLGMQGEAALDSGNWAAAEDDFRRADALYHAPSLVLGLARAYSHEGKVVEAWESYYRVIQENVTSSPIFARALRDATVEIPAVEARRGHLTIRVTGADAPRAELDDVPLKPEAIGIERLINPGRHTVSVTADARRRVTKTVDIGEGRAEVLSVTLEPIPAPDEVTPVPPLAEQALL